MMFDFHGTHVLPYIFIFFFSLINSENIISIFSDERLAMLDVCFV